MKTTGHGYSIWLAPDKEHKDLFSKLIYKLGKVFKSPLFEPHITLLGEIDGGKKEVIEKTKKLAKNLRSFPVETYKADSEPEYFRALFVHVKKTKEIVDASKQAQEIFGMKEDYVPHMSLAYCKAPKRKKVEFTNDIRHTLKDNDHFMIRKLCLYETNGNVSEWKLLKTFYLK